ncbi:Mannose-1-phosphate guanylyltransferase 1 [Moraxella caprae]|uniref:mannose-1-phosphate guanylyltransferase n=1 Tax=Moraxella caprae TaxID=90240 RepID=A0A378QYA8_9GAMM|nr:mannose-1-phosphate guanylyltransferase/mannose-6-phosphate isomerase [Moraxella caprae]STZ07768.1 Mannose-1-phosphate guanylyltransferase 1 [Moraxella caprae]
MLQPIIIAGGTGSRLWPLSRELFPKQFHKLHGDLTMLQTTILRLEGLDCAKPIVICNENHRFLVAEQLRQIGYLDHNIILEPVGKNTAPAIALTSFYATQNGKNPNLLVLPADHIILDKVAFQTSVKNAISHIENNQLVTFGIVPNAPETGYGYIQCGEKLGDNGFLISQFVEKPDLQTAQNYLSSGDYLWNSGMFAFRAQTYLNELQKHRPDIHEVCEKSIQNTNDDLDFVRIDNEIFATCPEDSIDYAVMEKTTDAVVVPMNAGWNDVGAWSSLWEVSDKDEQGNAKIGDVLAIDSHNNYLFAETGLVATVGVSDAIVVQTKDAVLVTNRDNAQNVKSLVQALGRQNRKEIELHREVYRPWGKYDSIDNGTRYQVKRITVKAGEKLSVQMHHHRAEHWIVVSGTAKVGIDDKEVLLTENESIYIPLGAVHYLENPGKIPLELIEVQVGSYLGEDDIVRFEDRYGRVVV